MPRRIPFSGAWSRGWLGCLAALATQACGAGRRQQPLETLEPLPARQQVQVWSDGEMQRWHALSDCDSCRLSIPRTDVDSVRLGNPTMGFWKAFALVVGIPVATFIIICSDEDAVGPPCSE